MTTFTFQRGETVSVALDAVQGDPATVTAISAAMKSVLGTFPQGGRCRCRPRFRRRWRRARIWPMPS
jgi:hypothetical protein